jgi:hypothetical protein
LASMSMLEGVARQEIAAFSSIERAFKPFSPPPHK